MSPGTGIWPAGPGSSPQHAADETKQSPRATMAEVSIDSLQPGYWHARVGASSRTVRRMLVAAACSSIAAAALLVLAVQAQPAVRQEPRAPAAMVTALLPDPLGCPSNIRCYDRLFAPPDLTDSFQNWFPGGTVLAGYGTYGLIGADRYQAELIGRSGTATIQLRTLCVPGGTSRSAVRRSTPPIDNVRPGLHLVVVSADRPGCTVAVTVDDPTPDDRLEAAAERLADDPSLHVGQ